MPPHCTQDWVRTEVLEHELQREREEKADLEKRLPQEALDMRCQYAVVVDSRTSKAAWNNYSLDLCCLLVFRDSKLIKLVLILFWAPPSDQSIFHHISIFCNSFVPVTPKRLLKTSNTARNCCPGQHLCKVCGVLLALGGAVRGQFSILQEFF